jgi:hypothetical protein
MIWWFKRCVGHSSSSPRRTAHASSSVLDGRMVVGIGSPTLTMHPISAGESGLVREEPPPSLKAAKFVLASVSELNT